MKRREVVLRGSGFYVKPNISIRRWGMLQWHETHKRYGNQGTATASNTRQDSIGSSAGPLPFSSQRVPHRDYAGTGKGEKCDLHHCLIPW